MVEKNCAIRSLITRTVQYYQGEEFDDDQGGSACKTHKETLETHTKF